MSGCSNYAENLWKKGKCSNCFRPKDQHSLGSKNSVLPNGETSLSKAHNQGLKNISAQTNGHSANKGQISSRGSVDRREFMVRKHSNSEEICVARDSELTKAALPSRQTTCLNVSNDKSLGLLTDDADHLDIIDKPKPIPRCKARSSPKNSSNDEDIFDNSSPLKSVNGTRNTIKSNITGTDIFSGNSFDSNLKQGKSGRKFSSKDSDLLTMEGEPNKDEPITLNNHKQSVVSVGTDEEYMPMKNNVCCDAKQKDSSDVKVESIKITSAHSSKRDDKSNTFTTKNNFTDVTGKQERAEKCNDISENPSTPSSLSSEARNKLKNRQDSLNSPPCYENQSSVERTNSSSSEKSLSKFPKSITSPSDRPESIAFKVQVDIEELRTSSIFEDIIIESSGSSSQSSQSTNSDDTTGENTGTGQGTVPTAVDSTTVKEQIMTRQSNPDVTKLVEGPEYTNSSVKPQTKPYKVVDISGAMLIPEMEGGNIDMPPLPPKEKDRQKETSGPDHYYYEPPDDIVPDYKKLTPLNTEPPPPPVIIKKDNQGTTAVPASLKAMPVPRPRSQISSYISSTLPRPIARPAKPGNDLKEYATRPVSQVVTRPTNTEAPRPPSTSSIPSRKPVTETSPPNSPTDTPARLTPDRRGSNACLDHKDTTIKPTRTAPLPPVLVANASQHTARSPTPTDPCKESPQSTPTPSPVRAEQTSHSKSTFHSAKTQGTSTIKRAWKRFSGRRKNKKKLDISSPVMMSEESDSTENGDEFAVCTSIKERKRASTIEEQPQEHESPNRSTSSESNDGDEAISLPSGKPTRPYQNFPFSKSNVEKPVKPDRQAKVKPVLQVKPEVNKNLNSPSLESPAYLEPCTGDSTLKVEAALANLNDAKILAETLSRVEQEKLGPLPQVPRSRHVHFKFNETNRPVTAVAPTVVNGNKVKHAPSRPSSTHGDCRIRSKSLTVKARPESTCRSRSSSIQETTMKKRYGKIQERHRQTIQDVIDSSKEELLPGDSIDVSNTRWRDYQVYGAPLQITSPGAVLVPVVVPRIDKSLVLLAKVKIPKSVTEDMSQRTAFMQDMATTVSLPFHANVSRTITHFTDHLPADLFGVESPSNFETLVTITDQLPVETVQEFMERTVREHMDLPDEYERKVCILMLQVLSALDHLHQQGLVHRALLPSNLLLLDHGHLVLSNFSLVLQKSRGDSSQFHYTKDDVGNAIGGDPHRIPPEIHKSYNSNKLIDFEKCDSFSAGCLIYELLHQENPFAVDPNLVSRDYTIVDLPLLSDVSRFTSGLIALASGLLQCRPSERMLPRDALKILQAFIWGPEYLDETSLEMSASEWLETERANAVIDIARTQAHSAVIGGEEVLENFLKYQYLVNVTEYDVVEGYKALMPTASQA